MASLVELPPQTQRDLLLDEIPLLVRKYGDVAATAAAEWYEETRATQVAGGYDATTVAPYDGTDISNTIRWQAGKLFVPDSTGLADVGGFLAGALQRWVLYSGRETVARNTVRDPSHPRFARVPTGAKTCAFCSLMASRGFVYHSEASAGMLHKWHGDCDCEIVAEWDRHAAHIAGYDPDAMYDRYLTARSTVESERPGSTPDAEAILARMRDMYPEHYTDGHASAL